RPEWTVQKLTEVGADQIVLLSTARCIVRWAASDRHLERLREVARQAAMQSRRVWLPEVSGPLPFTDLEVGRSSQAGTGRPSRVPSGSSGGRGLGEPAPGGAVALAVPGGRPPELGTALLIGPEGGWTDEELAAVPIHVGLGPHVLRAETAALAAAVLLSGLRERLVAPAS
ncbi:MAG TPA: RsmE family RNA methyltransferase, partial [Acidimicrobiales bacterium]|nr:RsmE family RNA methyltransferase [Acidimicrobiales bacterium]